MTLFLESLAAIVLLVLIVTVGPALLCSGDIDRLARNRKHWMRKS